ncbi:MAG: membrane dipeptidase, partial [Bacteroidales bacterium]|nr:membrane dipeptidase [Bacteroidales bacterium]
EDISYMPLIFDEMRSRGYSEDDIEKIAGGNFLRLLKHVSLSSGE